jgi:hypothetical protein
MKRDPVRRTRHRPPAADHRALTAARQIGRDDFVAPVFGLLLAVIALAGPGPARGQLLEGEFASIDLGRKLIEPTRFPTIRELRAAVRKPEIGAVLMLKLFTSGDNHHLPIFSGDGRRLAFQRSDVQARSSKLLLFPLLSDAEPTMLTDDPAAYDYMFQWGVNSPNSYTFVRIDPGGQSTRIFVSTEGGRPVEKRLGKKRRRFPALYRRTDGIWRLVYEEEGRLMHEAWDDEGPVDEPLMLARATSPRWSRDGYRLLMARERPGGNKLSSYDIAVWNLRTETEVPLSHSAGETVRSPCWSPDEHAAAFFVRQGGEGNPWRIRVCPVAENATGRTLGNDVVVNADFESQGPAWQPDGQRVWFFSNEHCREAYYPLVSADVETGQLTVVDYPRCCTTPHDLAINPSTSVPEMAFVAHDGLPKDVFILFLNHY